MRKLGLFLFLGLCLCILTIFLIISPEPAKAFGTAARWPNTNTILYSVDPNAPAALGVSGSAFNQAVTDAVVRWNFASAARLVGTANYDPNGNVVTTADLSTTNPCSTANPNPSLIAVVCWDWNSVGYLTRTHMYMSTHRNWNTGGILDCSNNYVDVLTLLVHEFGHMYALEDFPRQASGAVNQDAVMSFYCNLPPKTYLREDDKIGATQMYGPWTGWEIVNGQSVHAEGRRNNAFYPFFNVAGYYNSGSPPPELGPTYQEVVPVVSGVRYLRMAGYSQQNYSYAYFNLFTVNDNHGPNIGNPYKVRIRSGMRLVYRQYNYQQSTMGLDFVTETGATLRDCQSCVDQNGIRAHPAARGVYGTGYWIYTNIDLTPLAGQLIDHFLVAYDNGNNGVTGQFRGYFDDVRIIHP